MPLNPLQAQYLNTRKKRPLQYTNNIYAVEYANPDRASNLINTHLTNLTNYKEQSIKTNQTAHQRLLLITYTQKRSFSILIQSQLPQTNNNH